MFGKKKKLKKKIVFIRELSDTVALYAASSKPEIKSDLLKLADDFKYSDPISKPDLEEIEESLAELVEELANYINGDLEAAKNLINRISLKLKERNMKVKSSK